MTEENKKSQSALPASAKSSSAAREEEVLRFWKENNIFEKSLEKEAPKGKYVFYDGPPFATGLPHYGHILGSAVKDVIGRYKTMSGYNVPRRWGWDCHGLPIENIVEKDLGISGKKAIEAFGIDKFTEYARSKVLTYVSEWKKTVDRMGRWVDFDNSYKTMDNTYIESVWWALGEMNKKSLLYEGVRVLAYCPRCETPIANSEIAMDNSYKDITDISVYVKFKLNPGQKYGEGKETKDSAFLLAWTTTPWTLPGNTAIAINKDIIYSALRVKGIPELLIVANECVKNVFKDKETEIVHNDIKGSDLVGLSYEPIFNYYKDIEMPNKENIWKVWHADFVTMDKGTGIAHQAPAFGEDDMNIAKLNNIPFIRHVEPNGEFSKEVVDFQNVKAKPKEDHQSTDILIIKYLAGSGHLFAKEKIIHSYPHCYRCDTPLIYYALPSWFINIQKIKENLLKKSEDMNWIPGHLKEGRFRQTMESAPDWTISRNRYWASPLPFWKSKEGKLMVVNSIEDLKNKTKKSGNKYWVMRHGQAECNVSDIIMNDEDSNNCKLTSMGVEQVTESANNFKEKIDVVIASPLERTRETTRIICEKMGYPLEKVIYNDLQKEWDVSSKYQGKNREAFEEFYCNKYKSHPFEKLPDGESYSELIDRVGKMIYEIDSQYSGKNILLVGHAGETSALCHVVQGFSYETLPTDDNFPPYLKNAEIRELDFVPLPHNKNYELDLHRPYIDSIILVDEKGEEYKRIPEVIDCWFESGSMPFAQNHFPFENPNWQKENFPGGFVAEYIAQTRTWFYYSHVISSVLFDEAPFENVVTTGTVLAEDGTKMSKSKNNYPDPWVLFNKYGVDALRFYLVSSTLMKGEDVNFSEKLVQEVSSKIINRFDNVVTFYELYRDIKIESNEYKLSSNILDQWIVSRLNQFISEVKNGMEAYDLALATKPFDLFVEDLSTWYLRRSRERMKDGDIEAKQTLHFVIKNTVQLFAPFMPFIAEDIWKKIKLDKDTDSIHLTNYFLDVKTGVVNGKIIKEMEEVREVVTLGLQARQKAGIPVRQPLGELRINNYELGIKYEEIIKDELNVKNIVYVKAEEKKVEIDTYITEELKQEGNYRELVRAIQDMRKKMGLNPTDIVDIEIMTSKEGEEIINKFEKELVKAVGVKEVQIKDNTGSEIKIDSVSFVVNLIK